MYKIIVYKMVKNKGRYYRQDIAIYPFIKNENISTKSIEIKNKYKEWCYHLEHIKMF